MPECGAHIALALATALSWFGLGSLLLAPLPTTGDRALDALNRFGAGAVAFSLATFAVGWLGVLHALVYLPLLAATGVAGAVALRRLLVYAARPNVTTWPRWELAAGVLIALYAVFGAIVTCAPISSADALYYHAALPEHFERIHGIEEVPWSWGSYQPFSVQMLVLDGFLLWDSVQGAFAPLLLGLGAAAAVFHTAYRFGGRSLALLAAALFLAQPFALWLVTSTFVEPGAALTVMLAVANLARYASEPRPASLALAGAFTGATAGTKYVAAAAAAVIAVAALVVLRHRLDARVAIAFALPAVAVALPWYAKNALLVGDPVYPFIAGWTNDEARRAARQTLETFGYGRSALDLVLLPIRLLADAEPFNRAEYISPLFMLFAPVALLVSRARELSALILGGTAVYVVFWFVGVQDSRYLFLAMGPLALVAAVGIVGLAGRGRTGAIVVRTVVAGAFAAGVAVSAVYASRFVPVALGLQSDDEFLTANVSYHEATLWLNDRLPRDARVVLDHVFVLHVDRPAIAWTSDALPTSAGPGETRRFFRRERLTHALVFASSTAKQRQLKYVGATLVTRLTVHAVTSRALSRVVPAEPMEVYRVADRFTRRTTPSAQAAGVNVRTSSRDRAPARARSPGSSASSRSARVSA